MSQNIDIGLGSTSPEHRNVSQNLDPSNQATTALSINGIQIIDMREDSQPIITKTLDQKFPPLQVLKMMTESEYLQYQRQVLKEEQETAKARA